TCGISSPFGKLFPTSGQVTYVLLTRSPLTRRSVRLACLMHAASVYPEPGSNSPSDPSELVCHESGFQSNGITLTSFHYSVVKVPAPLRGATFSLSPRPALSQRLQPCRANFSSC